MNKQKILKKIHGMISIRLSMKRVIGVGVVLLIFVAGFAGYREIRTMTGLAADTTNTLKNQCMSYNKLIAADRTKSLYRLSDLMRDFRTHLAYQPSVVTDAYLEDYVDSMRLSGIALLDGDKQLEASGYTRQFRDADWIHSQDGSRFADIFTDTDKIYTERVEVDGEYYDLCALARLDAPGILVGFYHQPSGLISGTETDLESLLSGLQLERDGHYAIVEDGNVRVTSDSVPVGMEVSKNPMLQQLSQIPKDEKLHLFQAGGKLFWGYRSGCENYSLYVYYSVFSIFSACILTASVFAALYSLLCLLYYAVRNETLYENQEELRRSNHNLTQTVEMLKALETIYYSLFYVDLEADSYHAIYNVPRIQSVIPPEGVYTELKQLFLDRFVVPEFRDEMDRSFEIAAVQDSLNRRNITDVRKSFYIDYQTVRGDQTPWCRMTATAVDYDEMGKPLHFLVLIQDIDQEKTKEADYQAQIIKEAHEAQIANEAKSEFLRRISHDIRTPINGIQGYIDLGADHPEDYELQEHCRERATMALHALLELLNSVMDMSKLESSEIVMDDKPFHLTELLDNANTVLIPQAQAKGVNYEVVREGGVAVPHLIGSPRHLSQIILNIATNAIKYTKPGGTVRVKTELVSRTDDTVTYRFCCEDNGVGMTEEFQQHMFEPFSQEASSARTTYEGTGLGLSIVKKLVDAMGGTITCDSHKDAGTTFTVQLTFTIDMQKRESVDDPIKTFGSHIRDKHILLVEDNELNMEIAEYFFMEFGASITKAWNGREAVDIFSVSEEGDFDLILMDIMMPQMDGHEATRAIRALDRRDARNIPILAMSANSFADDVQKSMDAGMNDHIPKPVDIQKLVAATERLLDQRCCDEIA